MQICRQRILVKGIVQGVGFRPYIFRIARQCNLKGFVNNNSHGVSIEIEGRQTDIEIFNQKLVNEAPPFSRIVSLEKKNVDIRGDADFRIKETSSEKSADTLIAPDIAVCKDCLHELFDPENRRFLYPFINCTNCGPRYTIIKTIPYDRPYTSMAEFNMCPQCQEEYSDPLDRRFHAQPNACPRCGPQLELTNNLGVHITSDNNIETAVQLIKEGNIVAIKGLGGFHLAVNPHNSASLKKLRDRKGRQAKPFALMARDIAAIANTCIISKQEKESLLQPNRPIVILKANAKHDISDQVAPGNKYFACMLPYTPLHHLLMQYFEVLVMTSANFTDEPITISFEESLERLKEIADFFLTNNRDILQRVDDSIVRVVEQERMIRRSRGYVPAPLFLSSATKKKILAVGGELKNTIAISRGSEVFFSQHIGDLDNPLAYRFFEDSIIHLQEILQIKAELIVCDMHPEYLSGKWARQQDLPCIDTQHHHAHLASVLAENKIDEPAIGIIFDGTGYGPDGTIWGGEVLIGNAVSFDRFAWFDPVEMPGGAAAVNYPWRMAYSYLKKSFADEIYNLDLPLLKNITEKDKSVIDQMIARKINTPLTSSCGRLFDAVSAILGICCETNYEAQAAIELEMYVDESCTSYYEEVLRGPIKFAQNIILNDLIKALVKDYLGGEALSKIAAKFHNTIVRIIVRVVEEAYQHVKIKKVAISGGVFQNVYLFNELCRNLKARQFEIITHKNVPANDGGLALGQIAIANTKL